MRVMFVGGPLDGTIRDIGEGVAPYFHIERRRSPIEDGYEFGGTAYYPQDYANAVGQTARVYCTAGAMTNLNDEATHLLLQELYREAAIQCYGEEYFEEWHSVAMRTFREGAMRDGLLGRCLINDSHTKVAFQRESHRGREASIELAVNLGSEWVRYTATEHGMTGVNRGVGMAIYNLRPAQDIYIGFAEMPKSYTDHPDYKAFVRAICASPEDDLPRLVFADWLDEHGEAERAEFIRLQIELSRYPLTYSDGTGRLSDMQLRANELERQFKEPLLYEFDNLGIGYVWRRGFISTVRLTLAQFQTHAGRIAAEHPVTTWVLTDRSPVDPRRLHSLRALVVEPVLYSWVTAVTIFHQRAQLPQEFGSIARGVQWHNFATIGLANQWLQCRCYDIARSRAETLERMDEYGKAMDDVRRTNHARNLRLQEFAPLTGE